MRVGWILSVVAFLAACGGQKPGGSKSDKPPLVTNKVDVIFVVDDSGAMLEEQDGLGRNFPFFIAELAGMQPDLHIGVVSSNMGAGAATFATDCVTGGDRGVFCRTREGDRCAQCGLDTAPGRFLRTVNPNFQGSLASAFTCLAALGAFGCNYEHPLQALRQSLVAPENAGFLRPDAYLAIFIVSNEDDCSAPGDSGLFTAAIPGQQGSLRCALEGHVCQGQHETGTGDVDRPLAECQAASDGALTPLSQLVDAVVAAKGDPRLVFVSGIIGWPLAGQEATARYRIRPSTASPTQERQLSEICQSPRTGSATPALRLKKFIESFPNHSVNSICLDDYREPLRRFGEQLRVAMNP
jgi:hypothetical protein